MNDLSPGCPTHAPDGSHDDAKQQSAQPSLQRAFMDRARRAVEREHEKTPRRLGQHLVALAAAFALTFGIVYVFDAFLTSMQKVMRMMDEQEERQQQEEADRKKKEPIPAYVVPPSD
jgi:Na+-transporting methylmalonyl-CoA/oxaloacetate decarboxylase gamma subunit